MKIAAKTVWALLSLLWLNGLLCTSAHGAEQVEQITLVRAASNEAIDALRNSDSDTLLPRPGDTLVLSLAVSGPYEVIVNKAYKSSLGSTIIQGTSVTGRPSLMVIGADGDVRGHLARANDAVQISSDERGIVTAWVKGVDAQVLPVRDGVSIPATQDIRRFERQNQNLQSESTPSSVASAIFDVSYARFETGEATVRIVIYYENTMNAASTVADYLVALTNTVFDSSGVPVNLEIAALKPVELPPPQTVFGVVEAMRSEQAPFGTIEQDLVSEDAALAAALLSSWNNDDGYLGWADLGGKFLTGKFSATRYRGYQDGNTLYPEDIFAHEIGHTLGAWHNRELADAEDYTDRIFSYAYGHLNEGLQRSVMSYVSSENEPSVYAFSNPEVSANGVSIGVPTSEYHSAFNARVLHNNRHVAAANQNFAFERVKFAAVSEVWDCGIFRGGVVRNYSGTTIELTSVHYIKPDGSVVSFPWKPGKTVSPNGNFYWGWCLPEGESNPLGTTYSGSFFRYAHPVSDELIEGPHFSWGETFDPQTELRVAYTDGGQPVGDPHRMIPIGDEVEVRFEADDGFALSEVITTCEGSILSNGFRVTATSDDCVVEASFSIDSDGDGIANDVDTDDDNDGVEDDDDAFPLDETETLDTDSDGIGNNADTDDDNDGVIDSEDAFPLDDSESADTDGDGIGDNADIFPEDPNEHADSDQDGVGDNGDNCPGVSNGEQINSDDDQLGDACDEDDDNDGVIDSEDAFPLDGSEAVDTDGDGVGNNTDNDDDGDGISDSDDPFPLDPSEWLDTDLDGIGNNADPDDDNDGLNDELDAFPLDASEQVDTDGDGTGDNSDNCPIVANADQLNSDADATGNACDTDDDNDGLTDAEETDLGTDPLKRDTDGDGWSDKEEADAGTDPLQAASQPELEGALPIWLLYEATR